MGLQSLAVGQGRRDVAKRLCGGTADRNDAGARREILDAPRR